MVPFLRRRSASQPLFFVLTLLILAFSFPARAEDWMARLDPAAYVYQLSIPGTHDAATGNGFSGDLGMWLGDAMGRTQDLSLAEQWAAGIRAFDLRPTVSGDHLHIHHGILPTAISFADAMHLLRDSVQAHPSEFAIVILRHEDDAEDDAARAQWPAMMGQVLKDETLEPFIIPFSRDLTVSDMRGHILVLSRHTYQQNKGGIISGWSHSATYADQTKASITAGKGGTKAPLYCQDFYEVTAQGASQKKSTAVKRLLTYTLRQHTRSGFIWTINHTSGYTAATSSDGCRDNAATQNSALLTLLQQEENAGPTGIILMDFAGTDTSAAADPEATMPYGVNGLSLTRAIIEQNFRYTHRTDPTAAVAAPRTARPHVSRTFDLSGRALTHKQKGLFIIDGRKVLMRP